jgi:hypothetical protein
LIGLGIVFVVAVVFIGSRFFPENMKFTLWRYRGSGDQPSAWAREDDDQRFKWRSDDRADGDEP